MKIRFILFITLLFNSIFSFSLTHYPKNALFFNFSADQYKAGNKNWGLAVSQDGRVYVANNEGLLAFNGIGWRQYRNAPCSIIRSVAVDGNDTVYTGGFKEFGFWKKDNTGILHYTSLSDKIASELISDQDIWRIIPAPAGIYFQSFSHIFYWNHETVEVIEPLQFIMYLHKVNELFLIEKNGVLCELKENRLIERTKLPISEIRVILPFGKERLLIGNSDKGLFIVDNDGAHPWKSAVSETLKSSDLNCAIELENGNYLFGTLLNGLYESDREGNILNHYSTFNTLPGNSIHALKEDPQGNVWIALNEGLSKMENTRPASFFFDFKKTIGSVSASAVFNGRLYIGSNKGLYYIPLEALTKQDPFEKMKFVNGTEGQVWQLLAKENELLCAHNKGLFKLIKEEIRLIYNGSGVFSMKEFNRNKEDYILLSTYHTPVILKKGENGFGFRNMLTGLSGIYNSAEIDQDGYIWFGHLYEGVTQASISDDLKSLRKIADFDGTYFGQKGYPVKIARMGHRIVFISNERFYFYNDINDRIEPLEEINNLHLLVKDISQVISYESSNYWIVGKYTRVMIRYDKGKAQLLKTVAFDNKGFAVIDETETVIQMDDHTNLVCLNNGFILYDKHKIDSKKIHPQVIIERLTTDNGKNEETYPLNYGKVTKLNASTESVRFDVGYLNSSSLDTYYQYRLKGMKNDWSRPVCQPSILFERLPKGKYVFEIRPMTRKNGEESDSESFSFEILSPWYLSWRAFVLWCILGMLTVALAIWFLRRKHLKELQRQDKLNEERRIREMNEILQQKVKSTNHELFGVTAAMLRKNEVLENIKSEIEVFSSKHPNLPVSRKLDKIVQRVEQAEGPKEDWSLFIMHFEQTHPDFFRSIHERFPTLTPAELKLCACLKLNLTTKEIASMLNISVRGVEAGRYRLRKKIMLDSSEGLNEYFMRNF